MWKSSSQVISHLVPPVDLGHEEAILNCTRILRKVWNVWGAVPGLAGTAAVVAPHCQLGNNSTLGVEGKDLVAHEKGKRLSWPGWLRWEQSTLQVERAWPCKTLLSTLSSLFLFLSPLPMHQWEYLSETLEAVCLLRNFASWVVAWALWKLNLKTRTTTKQVWNCLQDSFLWLKTPSAEFCFELIAFLILYCFMTAEIAWLDASTHELLDGSCILFYGLTSVLK